ncbi:hypothetical protein ACJZ2D_006944 [Fusarium nematophilum]
MMSFAQLSAGNLNKADRIRTPLQRATLCQHQQGYERVSLVENSQTSHKGKKPPKDMLFEFSASQAEAQHGRPHKSGAELTPLKELQLDELFDMDAFFPSLDVEQPEGPLMALDPKNECLKGTPNSNPSDTQTESLDSGRGVDTASIACSTTVFGTPPQLHRPVATTEKPLSRLPPCQSKDPRDSPLVLFSCYHFVSAEVIWSLDQDDSRYLERRGCLHLPAKPALDEFVQQYFLHVHPILPLINEGDFWAMYRSPPCEATNADRLSLVVLQAMIFVACPFVPTSTLEDLGLSSARHARSVLYSKTKTLFHMGNHRDNVSRAQAALMLTYHAPAIYDRTNSYWLGIAIHFAKMGGADQYQSNSLSPECTITLKRLWWCCILRDRIMTLGLGRSLQIKPTDFDFSQPALLADDIEDEIHGSEVYDPATKRVLIRLIASLCELAVAMNDILILCYPLGPNFEPRSLDHSPRELRVSFFRLDEWHQAAVANLQIPAGLCEVHGSLTLFVNAIYIYYYAAKACLNHHILHLITNGNSEGNSLYEAWHASEELADALRGITQSFIELKRRNLAKYLPNTFVALSLLPLVWQVSHSNLGDGERSPSAEKNLDDLYDTVKELQNLYEMTDSVLQYVGKDNVYGAVT